MDDRHGTAHVLRLMLVITLCASFAFAFVAGFEAPVKAQETYKIGTLLPLTGAGGPQGPEQQRGNILAAKHINAAGGPNGYNIELVHRDSGTNPTVAVDAARKLVQVDGVVAIVGAWSSGVSKAVAQGVTIPNQIVQIMQGSTSPLLSVIPDNDYLFRACMQDLYQGGALAEIIHGEGHRTLSITYVNNPYGKGLADATEVRFEKLGGEVLQKVPHEIGKASYSAEIARTYEGNPDAVLWIPYPEDAIVMFKEALEKGHSPSQTPWYGTDSWKVPQVIQEVGEDALTDVTGTSQGVLSNPSLKTFRREFASEFGHVVQQPFTENGYDATVSIALAIANSGKSPGQLRSRDIRDNLRSVTSPPGEKIYAGTEEFKQAFQLLKEGKPIDYEGVAGKVAYDEYGDAKSAVQTWKIQGGTFVVADNFIPEPVAREEMPPEYQR